MKNFSTIILVTILLSFGFAVPKPGEEGVIASREFHPLLYPHFFFLLLFPPFLYFLKALHCHLFNIKT